MPVGVVEGRVYFIEKSCSGDGVANDAGILCATDERGNQWDQLAKNVRVAQLATPELAGFA